MNRFKNPIKKSGAETYLPPEGVPITFEIASMSSRFGAQAFDLVVTWGSLILIIILFAYILSIESLFTLIVLGAFFTRVPYYILSELIWNGRTLGKRLAGIRVINVSGRRLTPHQVTARNLMKEIEFFTPLMLVLSAISASATGKIIAFVWVCGVALVPFLNRRRQRLGDIIAGTMVVRNPRATLLPDLAAAPKARALGTGKFTFQPHQLDIYGRHELQTLETVLRNPPKSPQEWSDLEEIVRVIKRKLQFTEPVRPSDEMAFLTDFYTAQREHLEALQLFGKRRENKFHGGEAKFSFQLQHLTIYGQKELKTLDQLLRHPPKTAEDQAEIVNVANAIIKRVRFTDPVQPEQSLAFLTAFYDAQRKHLDARKPAT